MSAGTFGSGTGHARKLSSVGKVRHCGARMTEFPRCLGTGDHRGQSLLEVVGYRGKAPGFGGEVFHVQPGL